MANLNGQVLLTRFLIPMTQGLNHFLITTLYTRYYFTTYIMAAAENRKAIIVGVFLSLGLVIFILGVFTLGGQQKSFDKSIHISAVFDDVAGLKKGNDIWFSGVKVGTISAIKFVGISQVNVLMKVDQNTQQYIHRNSGVRISSDGLIGNKIIVIDGGSPQAPVVQEGDVLQAEKLPST